MPVDFSEKEFEAYRRVHFLFEQFSMLVNAVSVATENNYIDMEAKSGSWKKVAEEHLLKSKVQVNILEGNDFTDVIFDFAKRNQHDLMLLFQSAGSQKQLMSRKQIIELLNQTDIPVLLYYHK